MIDESTVRALAARRGQPTTTSVYLDVDGRHRPVKADYVAAFDGIAEGLARRALESGDPRLQDAVAADTERMRSWLDSRLDRMRTRGVAMFACTSEDWFTTVPLPRPVHDEGGIAPSPRVNQLVALLEQHERFLVALIDRRRLRLVRVELGEAVELPELDDQEPRAVDTNVELGSWEHHREEAARMHYRRAARRVDRAVESCRGCRLLIGGPVDAVAGVEEHLAAPTKAAMTGRVDARVASSLNSVVAATLEIEESLERGREAAAVDEFSQAVAGGYHAVEGLDATLAALADRRAELLLVSEGFEAPGGRCSQCGRLATGSECPGCGAATQALSDVVEPAIEEALKQRARVQMCHDGALDRSGHIGVIERY